MTMMPTLVQSTSTDAKKKAQEDKQFEMLYEAKIQAYVMREQAYERNKGKSYALIFGQCNKAMQNKLVSRKTITQKSKEIPKRFWMLLRSILCHTWRTDTQHQL